MCLKSIQVGSQRAIVEKMWVSLTVEGNEADRTGDFSAPL